MTHGLGLQSDTKAHGVPLFLQNGAHLCPLLISCQSGFTVSYAVKNVALQGTGAHMARSHQHFRLAR